jgi:hypothetical protein
MNNDAADERAKARKRLGLTRELGQDRAVLPHPSRGGCRGYPVWSRQEQLLAQATGQPTTASAPSLSRWLRRLHPYRMTGNKASETIVK